MSAIFETEFIDLRDEKGDVTKASTAKLVLLALADHANDEGESAYPSVERLARKTALAQQTVRNTFDALRHNGVIFLNGQSKYRTNNYTINTGSFPRLMGNEDGILTLNRLEGQMGEVSPSNRSLLTLNRLDPNHHINTNKTLVKLSEKEIKEANQMVDAIISNASRKDLWKGREYFRDNHLPYADWYHETTGQVCMKKIQRAWQKAFSEWHDFGLSFPSLQASYDAKIKWTIVSDPNQLTKDAAAIQALPYIKTAQTTTTQLQYDDHGRLINA